jgi:hypothetical protein
VRLTLNVAVAPCSEQKLLKKFFFPKFFLIDTCMTLLPFCLQNLDSKGAKIKPGEQEMF